MGGKTAVKNKKSNIMEERASGKERGRGRGRGREGGEKRIRET